MNHAVVGGNEPHVSINEERVQDIEAWEALVKLAERHLELDEPDSALFEQSIGSLQNLELIALDVALEQIHLLDPYFGAYESRLVTEPGSNPRESFFRTS